MAVGRRSRCELGRRAAELDLEIALELEPFPLSLVNNVDTMVRFLDDVDLPNVMANLDISHLVLSRVDASEIRRLRGRVGHVHLSDCDGRVHGDLPPGRGVVPFEPYLREIRDLALGDRAISIELEYVAPARADRRVGRGSLSRNRQVAAKNRPARLTSGPPCRAAGICQRNQEGYPTVVHEAFMRRALEEAEAALAEGEVPVGAVIVHQQRIIASAHNQRELLPTRRPTPR